MQSNNILSTRAPPTLKKNHYSVQPSASINNVIYATRFARGVHHATSHLFVVYLDISAISELEAPNLTLSPLGIPDYKPEGLREGCKMKKQNRRSASQY